MRDAHLNSLAAIPEQTTARLIVFREMAIRQLEYVEKMLKEHVQMVDTLNREIEKRMSQ